jgi:hypothetical protein
MTGGTTRPRYSLHTSHRQLCFLVVCLTLSICLYLSIPISISSDYLSTRLSLNPFLLFLCPYLLYLFTKLFLHLTLSFDFLSLSICLCCISFYCLSTSTSTYLPIKPISISFSVVSHCCLLFLLDYLNFQLMFTRKWHCVETSHVELTRKNRKTGILHMRGSEYAAYDYYDGISWNFCSPVEQTRKSRKRMICVDMNMMHKMNMMELV